MYQPHNILWLLGAFVLCCLLLVATFLRSRLSQSKMPKWIFAVIIGLALSQFWLALGITAYDKQRLRSELRAISAAEVARIEIKHGAQQKQITNSSDIGAILTALQTVRSVAAHHSQPLDKFGLSFDYRGHHFRYVIGRDSERSNEFWVCLPNELPLGEEGLEIGRVQSDKLGAIAANLLKQTPKAQSLP